MKVLMLSAVLMMSAQAFAGCGEAISKFGNEISKASPILVQAFQLSQQVESSNNKALKDAVAAALDESVKHVSKVRKENTLAYAEACKLY